MQASDVLQLYESTVSSVLQLDKNRQGNTDRGRELHEFVRQATEQIDVRLYICQNILNIIKNFEVL